MSSALAIAAVTAVLKDLLDNALIDHGTGPMMGNSVLVSALAPDLIKLEDSASNPARLNIFMYHATPNQGWRNAGLPSRNAQGDRTSNPPLALDLHYLITAYASKDLHAEILLGYAMQLLHEVPVLTRAAIVRALNPDIVAGTTTEIPDRLKKITVADLADQVELVKITPELMSMEEMSKLWTAIQGRYRPTAAYKASVVLIESKASTRVPLPVRERNIYVIPFQQPVIEEVLADGPDGRMILQGSTLLIRGDNLMGDGTTVFIDGDAVTPIAITGSQINVKLPAALPSGVHGLQVGHQMQMGTPPHRGVESNMVPFVLHPRIKTITVGAVTDRKTTPEGINICSATIEVEIEPHPLKDQRVVLLLNEVTTTGTPAAYSFIGPDRATDTTPVSIPVKAVKETTYFVRVQVDGVQSFLLLNTVTGEREPQVKIP